VDESNILSGVEGESESFREKREVTRDRKEKNMIKVEQAIWILIFFKSGAYEKKRQKREEVRCQGFKERGKGRGVFLE